MLHSILITIHATAALIALAAGVMAFLRSRGTGLHAMAMVVMTGTLAAALAARPPTASGIPVFLALLGLATVMCVRSCLAWRDRLAVGRQAEVQRVARIGFACIGLIAGFVAIAVLPLDQGVVPIALATAGAVLLARVPVARAARRAAAGGS